MDRKRFAAAVVAQLAKHRISCVLVGGACLSIYTDEAHASRDLDFISPSSLDRIHEALDELGFIRKGREFHHQLSDFYLEFPSGPVAIGNEVPVKPLGKLRVGKTVIKMLSPTQCVMDRLAAWFHWNDRRSLIHAVWVCEKHMVSFSKIKQWSIREGELDRYQQFLDLLKSHKVRRRKK